MKNRPFNILFGMIIFSVVLFMMYLVFLCLISLIRMEDKITFSSSIVICLISSPLLFYATAGSVYIFVFNKKPKFNKMIVKYLTMLAIASFIISFPVSFYVDNKLKSNGYVVCDRISWMSPNFYVRDLSLCR